jgi:hypothetical protein
MRGLEGRRVERGRVWTCVLGVVRMGAGEEWECVLGRGSSETRSVVYGGRHCCKGVVCALIYLLGVILHGWEMRGSVKGSNKSIWFSVFTKLFRVFLHHSYLAAENCLQMCRY